MKEESKGICQARGFLAGAGYASIKGEENGKDDLALIYSAVPCNAAAVYTSNAVKADCLKVTKMHLANGKAQGIIINSGNANAAAPDGYENALRQAAAGAKALGLQCEDMIVASTGVIGQRLPVEKIEKAAADIEVLEDNSSAANIAIMTTDTVEKTAALSFELDGKTCYLGGICKGSGMIHPNMGTMLCFLSTDAAIAQPLMQKALLENTKTTFNRISVDGDTSTNDMCVLLANGLAQNSEITQENAEYKIFYEALHAVMESLAKQIAADGEGASRLVSVSVQGARTEEQAEGLAKSVLTSLLVKTAMFGADANCGRILCALGYSGLEFEPEKTDVSYKSQAGSILVCQNGLGLAFDEEKAKEILDQKEVEILIDLHEGDAKVICWGCDLTYEYVKINGEYRS